MIERTLHKGRARLLYGAPNLETLARLADDSVQCVVTSPPYFGLRRYGDGEQIGLEQTPEQYIENLLAVFDSVRRVLKSNGTLWLNLGDSYKDKRLLGIPWRVALGLQGAGWYLRQDIIWHKPAPMPSSAKDRCTAAHEYIFLLTKSPSYLFNQMVEPSVTGERFHGGYEATMGDGSKGHSRNGRNDADNYTATRNKRSVWTIGAQSYHGAHFAVFPEDLPRLAVAAGSNKGDLVLDPFSGSGTTGKVALQLGRQYIGLDINKEYIELALRRVDQFQPDTPTIDEEQGQQPLFRGIDE